MSFETEINFCINFLQTVDPSKPSIYSPTSLLNAFAIIYLGASGKTAEELSKLIGKDQTKSEIIEYYSNFIKHHKITVTDESDIPPPTKKLKSKHENHSTEDDSDSSDSEDDNDSSSSEEEEDLTPSSKVIIASRLFVSEKIKVKKSFEEMLSDKFDGKVQKVDFDSNVVLAEKIINEYVSKATQEMIEGIIELGDIPSSTSLILINAIYFIGKWECTFNFQFTQKFYSTKIREMKFMRVGPILQFYFNEGKEWEAVGIPYRERQCWMFIVLPKQKDGLGDLIKAMDYSVFLEATKATDSGKIEVTMPMFEISESYNLEDNLSQLGFTNIFQNSDISEMVVGPHRIDKAIHKSMIKVDEYGTMASAVTSSVIVPCSMSGPRKFIADHPFLFFIVSMKDKVDPSNILFAGKFC